MATQGLSHEYLQGLYLQLPKLEMTQMSFNWGMDKQIVAYPCKRRLLSNKQEQITGVCNNMDEFQMHYLSKSSQTKKALHFMIVFM